MALTFRTPGPLSIVGAGLTDRLKQTFPPALFEHAFMPAKLTPQAWTALVRRTPFIGLGWNTLDAEPVLARQFRGASRWTVFLVTRNSSGPLGRYFGDAQGPGLFQMVEAASVMLQGYDLPGVGNVVVKSAANSIAEGWEDGGAAIAAIDVDVSIDMSRADMITAGLSVDDLSSTHVAWDFLPATGSLADTHTGVA